MELALRKIKKPLGCKPPNELETKIAQAIFELEVNLKELKADLQTLHFVHAKEVQVLKGKNSKNALVIYVPEKQYNKWKKIHVKLTKELEKKFGEHVLIVGNRIALTKSHYRPRKNALSSVHEDFLHDVCYPLEVTGMRTRVRVDGTRLVKIQLDSKERQLFESKLQTFNAVYKFLTGKTAKYSFEF